jgi:hypothetical protein
VTPLACADLQELACDLALDLLTGAERAAALAHLERCRGCRAEVASLMDVGEAVLALAPGVPPSAGFEVLVLDRIAELRESGAGPEVKAGRRVHQGLGRARWPSRHRPRPAGGSGDPAAIRSVVAGGGRRDGRPRPSVRTLAAASALVVAAVLAATLLLGRGRDDLAVASADMITSRGQVVGRATLGHADPAVVVVDVGGWVERLSHYGEPDDHHDYWLAVESRGGARDLYALPVSERGTWHVPLAAEPAAVAAVSVVDDTGRVFCSGRFPPP